MADFSSVNLFSPLLKLSIPVGSAPLDEAGSPYLSSCHKTFDSIIKGASGFFVAFYVAGHCSSRICVEKVRLFYCLLG